MWNAAASGWALAAERSPETADFGRWRPTVRGGPTSRRGPPHQRRLRHDRESSVPESKRTNLKIGSLLGGYPAYGWGLSTAIVT
jgi:hypothetical protein